MFFCLRRVSFFFFLKTSLLLVFTSVFLPSLIVIYYAVSNRSLDHHLNFEVLIVGCHRCQSFLTYNLKKNLDVTQAFSRSLCAFPQCLSFSLSLCFASPLFCHEGHQASGDPVPQEESKSPPSSLLLFFHNLLFMSDRPPPDKWLPYGERKTERQRRRKERGKKSLYVSFSSSL